MVMNLNVETAEMMVQHHIPPLIPSRTLSQLVSQLIIISPCLFWFLCEISQKVQTTELDGCQDDKYHIPLVLNSVALLMKVMLFRKNRITTLWHIHSNPCHCNYYQINSGYSRKNKMFYQKVLYVLRFLCYSCIKKE